MDVENQQLKLAIPWDDVASTTIQNPNVIPVVNVMAVTEYPDTGPEIWNFDVSEATVVRGTVSIDRSDPFDVVVIDIVGEKTLDGGQVHFEVRLRPAAALDLALSIRGLIRDVPAAL
jgi:hypothetical protein